ncbi:rhodanese-like domain-containing protein [Kribbella ginsengisoli]|uniref:Rhodanese-like domain-containing protein n=1 Tax=Kribbella ginsengisoli TaxID=363865 RepID=A0ABP6Z8I0_9ACTN
MCASARELVAAARGQIRNLSVDDVAMWLETSAAVIVDIREPDEVGRDGAIPGAIHAARGLLEFWADPECPQHRPEFDNAKPIILYSASGSRSALAALALEALGYTDVGHLDGGLIAWREQGRPITRAFAAGTEASTRNPICRSMTTARSEGA